MENRNCSKSVLQDRLNEIYAESKEKWNFDFEAEKPLPGKYDWQAVKEDDVPSCYREKEYPKKSESKTKNSRRVRPGSETRCRQPGSSRQLAAEKPVDEKPDAPANSTCKRKLVFDRKETIPGQSIVQTMEFIALLQVG